MRPLREAAGVLAVLALGAALALAVVAGLIVASVEVLLRLGVGA